MATHLTSLMWRLCFHSNLENELLIFRLALLVYMLAIEKAFFMRDRRFCGRGMKTELVSLSLLTAPATSWFNIIHTHTHTNTHTHNTVTYSHSLKDPKWSTSTLVLSPSSKSTPKSPATSCCIHSALTPDLTKCTYQFTAVTESPWRLNHECWCNITVWRRVNTS